MFGDEILSRVRVVNHVAANQDELTWCGTMGRGVPVWLNSEWVEADVRITTGFVEPHFFAGFSGGPKMVAPGLAGLETVLTLHNANRIGDARATWGVLEGNPVHEDIATIARVTGVTFALDVVLNRDQEVIAAYAGELFSMHRAACDYVRAQSMRVVDAPFDIVVTSNSGYPLDQNLYQAVKGMSAAAEIVKDGGLIICAAECRDGFPDHGGYRALLSSAASPEALLEEISARDVTVPDQWQVQIQAKVQSRARVVVHTAYLSDDDVLSAHLEQTNDVSQLVHTELARLGSTARVCVLPEGPQTIPYIAASPSA
jgi:nickel-dependent lactate racemase